LPTEQWLQLHEEKRPLFFLDRSVLLTRTFDLDEPDRKPSGVGKPRKEKQMRIFLTGATGYVGSAVAEELVGKGHEVLALARSKRSVERLQQAGYQVIWGDLQEALGLAQGATAADAVIHTAFSPSNVGPELDARAVSALIQMLDGTGKPLIYTSAVWIYGDTGEEVVREDTPLDPPAEVAWRVVVEDMVLEAAERGVNSVVIRPGIVYGVGGGILEQLRREAQTLGFVRVVEGGDQRWPFVHRHDLAALYGKALSASPGSVFNGTAGTSPPLVEVASIVAQSVSGVTKILSWPLSEARKEIGWLADVRALDQRYVSNEKAQSELGWVPREAPVLSDVHPPTAQGASA
jgi:nucleoside-diphosphate-sugar epimerase